MRIDAHRARNGRGERRTSRALRAQFTGTLDAHPPGASAKAHPSTPAPLGPRSGPGATGAASRDPAPASPQQPESRAAALEYHEESESDRVFIENAERAIGEYSEFIARAGDSAEYGPAVKRSREQIEDLRAAIDFDRAGAAQRVAH